MILACPFCHARFLIQANLFDKGPRKVKCARCRHDWLDDGKEDPGVTAGVAAEIRKTESVLSAPPPAKRIRAYESFVLLAEKILPPLPPLSPIVMQIAKAVGAGLLTLIFLVWLAADRERISDQLPFLEKAYNFVGLHVYHYGGHGLVFQNIRSELRYDSGITKLNVEGRIHNGTDKIQEMPDILATATGADGKPIQSWRIDAPTVRLDPGEDTVFRSSINAPRVTVIDINLSFVERKKDASAE